MYDFSDDSILLVLASELYDPKEYIRDYEEFAKLVNAKENMERQKYEYEIVDCYFCI